MILGLRTILYRVPDIDAAKTWYRAILERDPYFDEPYYVGFNVGGFELGLNPDEAGGAPGPGGTVAYWGVKDARAAVKRLRGLGVVVASDPEDVGGGILVATVRDPWGNEIGIIENPHFDLGAVS
ncbi:MAG: VOC family protein [Ardenticatenales bacterium]|jgi:predicted enzyme related to lactoylglutathione lyase|nr:VOC family protein [Ardenticatenales bacterium]